MRPLRAVLFDRDDTLSLNDAGVYRQAALWLHERQGLDPRAALGAMQAQWTSVVGKWEHLRTLDDEAAFWDAYARELAGRLGAPGEVGLDIVREWPYERFLLPAPNVREVLGGLRALGLRIGVLSNTLPNVGVTLRAIGVDDLVDVALASCTLGVSKPHADAFVLAARELGVRPDEVLFVDDKQENVDAARAVGMHALLIDHTGGRADAVHDLGAVLAHARDLTGQPA